MFKHIVGIVSGGAGGLGAGAVSHLVRHGGRVVVADLPEQRDAYLRLAASAAAIESSFEGGDNPVIAFAEVDVTKEEQVSAALDLAESRFGEPVNASISCAGIAVAMRTLSKKKKGQKPILHPLTDFKRVMDINAVGTFNLGRLASERMSTREPDEHGLRGCVINTSSIAAYDGQTGQTAYAASKSAVVGMTLPMARDLAPHGIRVMTVAPGLFKTPLLAGLPETVQNELASMIPCPSRLGEPDEFARLVACILENPMLNGEVIRLDGALRMPP